MAIWFLVQRHVIGFYQRSLRAARMIVVGTQSASLGLDAPASQRPPTPQAGPGVQKRIQT